MLWRHSERRNDLVFSAFLAPWNFSTRHTHELACADSFSPYDFGYFSLINISRAALVEGERKNVKYEKRWHRYNVGIFKTAAVLSALIWIVKRLWIDFSLVGLLNFAAWEIVALRRDERKSRKLCSVGIERSIKYHGRASAYWVW